MNSINTMRINRQITHAVALMFAVQLTHNNIVIIEFKIKSTTILLRILKE